MRKIGYWMNVLWTVAILLFVYACWMSYNESRDNLFVRAEKAFQDESVYWVDSLLYPKQLNLRGNYKAMEYIEKKGITIFTDGDSINISSAIYHPLSYSEYLRKNMESILILSNKYDVGIIDSLFAGQLKKLNLDVTSSIELHVKDFRQMFPAPDSLCKDIPVSKMFVSKPMKGRLTNPIEVGICGHALLYGKIDVSFVTILKDMTWFGLFHWIAYLLMIALLGINYFVRNYMPLFLTYEKELNIIGNTCFDLNKNVIYTWNGECRQLTGNKIVFVRMLVDSAPRYRLLKEDICRTIWNRTPKDGQALYNVIVSELRGMFIADDPSLELKSLPKEGVQLFIDESKVKKHRRIHFLFLILFKRP